MSCIIDNIKQIDCLNDYPRIDSSGVVNKELILRSQSPKDIAEQYQNMFKLYFSSVVLVDAQKQVYKMKLHLDELKSKHKDLYTVSLCDSFHSIVDQTVQISRVFNEDGVFVGYDERIELLTKKSMNIVLIDHDVVYGGQFVHLKEYYESKGHKVVDMLVCFKVNPNEQELLDIEDFTTPLYKGDRHGIIIEYDPLTTKRVPYQDTKPVMFEKLTSIPVQYQVKVQQQCHIINNSKKTTCDITYNYIIVKTPDRSYFTSLTVNREHVIVFERLSDQHSEIYKEVVEQFKHGMSRDVTILYYQKHWNDDAGLCLGFKDGKELHTFHELMNSLLVKDDWLYALAPFKYVIQVN